MRIAGESVGIRGGTLMTLTAAVGIVLAVHGWTGRTHALPSASGALGAGTKTTVPGASPAAGPSTAPSAGPSSSPAAKPTASATKVGPKLSSQSYYAFSFQVWPGPPSATAQAAETGLSINVRTQGTGIAVAAGVAGQPASAPTYYPAGAKVYVLEASMGDDSGSDFNLGDDGLIVTDTQGRILQ